MKNNKYWQERFKQLEEARHKQAETIYLEIEDTYIKAQKEIERNINNWYLRFANNNNITMTEAKKLLNSKELKEFKWDVQEYIKYGKENKLNGKWIKELENASAKFHISKLEALKVQVQQSLEVLFGNELDIIDKTISNTYINSYYHTIFEIQQGFNCGFKTGTIAIDNNKLSRIISKPWATDEKNFSERIWESKTKLINEVHKQLTTMCLQGKAPDRAIKNIAKKFNTTKAQVGKLVMTESAYFSSLAQKDCFKELEVEKYEIVATLDTHTSDICQEQDGKVYSMKDYEAGITAPPFHCYCRSCTAPYFEDDYNIADTRIARDEKGNVQYIPNDMKYKEWYKKYVNNKKVSTNNNKDDKITNKLGNSNKNNIGGNGQGQFVEKISKNQIKQKLNEYEEEIKNMSIEYGVLIDNKGNVYAYTGDKTNLSITDRSLNNVILTHNHPEIGSFGEDDYNMLTNNQEIKELRAVDKEYSYSLKILRSLDKSYNEFYKQGLQLSIETQEELQHCIMKKIEEGGYIKYERRRT